MGKEAASRPVAEELALRIKPVRQPWPSAWLGTKAVMGVLLALGAAVAVVAFLLLRDMGPFSRRKIAFPSPPRLDAAIVSAQERLKGNPQDISALAELGTLHFEKGKDFYPDAINELEEARELGALDPRIFYCLGIMYQEEGLYPFALEEYRRFLRHYPNDKETRLLAAKLLYKQGNFVEAVGEYERLKFSHPKDALIEENLGLSLRGAKLTDRAVESFTQLKGAGGDAARRADFHLGQIAFDRGRFEEALRHFLDAQPEQGSSGMGIPSDQLRAELAASYQKLGRLEEAKAAWEKVLEIAPADAKAKAAVRELARRIPAKRKASPKKR